MRRTTEMVSVANQIDLTLVIEAQIEPRQRRQTVEMFSVTHVGNARFQSWIVGILSLLGSITCNVSRLNNMAYLYVGLMTWLISM